MKFLRNPIAVMILAVLAVAYTVWTILGARGPRPTPSSALSTPAGAGAGAGAGANAIASAPGGTAAAPGSLPTSGLQIPTLPLRSMDRIAVVSNASRWIESPRRDPFRLEPPALEKSEEPRAAELLSLRAVWRQTGSQLAILNGQILREGESILNFEVESIEADAVWVRGPHGRERIGFPASPAPPGVRTGAAFATTPGGAPLSENITVALPVAPLP